MNLDLKLQLIPAGAPLPLPSPQGLCPSRRVREALDRHPSANVGVPQTPPLGTQVPLLRAQSDLGHVLPASPSPPLGSVLGAPSAPPLPGDGLTLGSVVSPTRGQLFSCPTSGNWLSCRPPGGSPPRHQADAVRPPPGRARAPVPLALGAKHYAIQASSPFSTCTRASTSGRRRSASRPPCRVGFLKTPVDFASLFSKNT